MQNIITYIIIAVAILSSMYLFWKRWFAKSDEKETDDSCSSCDDGICSDCDNCNLKNELKNRKHSKS